MLTQTESSRGVCIKINYEKLDEKEEILCSAKSSGVEEILLQGSP